MPLICGHNPPLPTNCRLCWRYTTDELYNRKYGGTGIAEFKDMGISDAYTSLKGTTVTSCKSCAEKPKFPNLGRQAFNFAKSTVNHILDGRQKVSQEESDRRISICKSCEFYSDDRCAKCGCVLSVKASWNSEKCPINKWDDKELTCSSVTENITVEQMIEVIERCSPGPWHDDWSKWKNTNEAHTRLLDKATANIPPYPSNYEGRGIVIAAGGEKYFTCAWVCISVLRHLGCDLPIQLWYLGDVEFDPGMKKLVKERFNVDCIDAREIDKKVKSRILAGWEVKPFSTIHCPFKEVLYLDADNIPVKNPEYLFDCLEYKEKGAMFFPDLPPEDKTRKEWVPPVVWERAGMPNHNSRAFESGQYIINKEKCWNELQLVKHLNDHSDFWYKLVFGDKDTFLLGFHKWAVVNKKEVSYAITETPAGWIQGGAAGAITQHDMSGERIFQHRCRPYPHKWSLNHGNEKVPTFVNEDKCFEALEDLKALWGGSLWYNYTPTDDEAEVARHLKGTYNYSRIGLGNRTIELLGGNSAGGRIGRGSAECEQRWSVFKEGDEFLLAICRDKKPTCILKYCFDGVWRGSWLEYEKCEVELTRIYG